MDELKLAKSLIKKFRTNDPFEICECLDYTVLSVPLSGVRGFCQHYAGNSIVYLREDLPDHVKRFVCGHELGHAIMHTGTNEIYMDTRTFLKTSIYERQADKFSVNLIYPDDDYFMDFQGFSISKIAKCLDLDEWLIEYRLKCLNK